MKKKSKNKYIHFGYFSMSNFSCYLTCAYTLSLVVKFFLRIKSFLILLKSFEISNYNKKIFIFKSYSA